MQSINIREARRRFSEIVDATSRGESFVITRRGHTVARLVPCEESEGQPLPAMGKFRDTVAVKGKSLSRTVAEMRRQERY